MKKTALSIAASTLIAGAIFTGCGGSGGLAGGFGGLSVNSYISGAQIWADLNGDGLETPNEITTTNANGRYSFTESPSSSPVYIESRGGIDTSTNKAYTGILKSTVDNVSGGTTVLSPITTIISSMIEQGTPAAEAKTRVANLTGLSEADLEKDTIAAAKAGNKDLLKKSLQFSRVIASTKTILGANTSIGDVVNQIAKQLVDNPTATLVQATTNAVTSIDNTKTADATNAATTLVNAIDNITDIDDADEFVDSIEKASEAAAVIVAANPSKAIDLDKIIAVIPETTDEQDIDMDLFIDAIDDVADLTADIDTTGLGLDNSVKTEEQLANDADAAAKQAIIDLKIANDTIKLANNIFNVGSKSVTLDSGSFGTIKNPTITPQELPAFYNIGFTLEDVITTETEEVNGEETTVTKKYSSLEDGDEKSVNLALRIADKNGSSKALLVVVKGVNLDRLGSSNNSNPTYTGEYKISIDSNTVLEAYGVKANGDTVSTTGVSVTPDMVSSTNNVVSLNVEKVVDSLEADSKFTNTITDIKNEFSQNGYYDVAMYIAGLNKVPNTAVVDGEVDKVGDISVASKITGTISKISGMVRIGLTAEEIAEIEAGETQATNDLTAANTKVTELTTAITDIETAATTTAVNTLVTTATNALTTAITSANAVIANDYASASQKTAAQMIIDDQSSYESSIQTAATNRTNALNQAPTLTLSSSTSSVEVGATSTVTFTTADNENDNVSVAVSSSDESKATAVVSGSTVTITGVAEGSATVSLTPSDSLNNGVAQEITVTVTTASTPALSLPSGFETQAVNNSNVNVETTVGSYTVKVMSNEAPSNATSSGTVAIYGVVNGTNTGSDLKLNTDYSESTTKLIVAVYSGSTLVHVSDQIDFTSTPINFGTITIN